jgi:hypothetical protein
MAKKTMRTKKRLHKKSKRGGFFFTKKVMPEICNITNLDSLNTSTDLHARYQTCCPKNFLGFKNRSTFCRNIDNKFQQVLKDENAALGGEEEMLNSDLPQPQLPAYVNPPQKPWYKFWGGRKTKYNRLKNKKNKSHKRRRH